jgi:hypothetical protein
MAALVDGLHIKAARREALLGIGQPIAVGSKWAADPNNPPRTRPGEDRSRTHPNLPQDFTSYWIGMRL